MDVSRGLSGGVERMGKTRQKQGVANASSADRPRLAASAELLKDATSSFLQL